MDAKQVPSLQPGRNILGTIIVKLHIGFIVLLLFLGIGTYAGAQMPEIEYGDWVSITGEINNTNAQETISALMNLEAEPATSPVGVSISSPGGSLTAVMAICDIVKSMKRPVVTIALGEALSGAALILSSGDKRYISEHTMVMLHQPNIIFESWSSSFDELRHFSKALTKIENQIYFLLAQNTGKSKEEIENTLQKETWFTSAEAVEFGLADEILGEGGLRIKKNKSLKEKKEETEEKDLTSPAVFP